MPVTQGHYRDLNLKFQNSSVALDLSFSFIVMWPNLIKLKMQSMRKPNEVLIDIILA